MLYILVSYKHKVRVIYFGNTPTGLKQEKTRAVPNHTVADGTQEDG
jgi:hypothetical protein